MTFGYTLLGALVLLLPGFAGYLGFRIGEASDFVSPRPDNPNSTLALSLIVVLALTAHVAGAGLFAINDAIAKAAPIIALSYDPNPYRALLSGHAPAHLTSLGIELELAYFLVLAIATGWLFERIARWSSIRARTYPLRFGWLLPTVQLIEAGRHVAVGYVRTTSGYNGAWIAYEGTIRRLTLDDDDVIRMVVLERCDRFLVKLEDGKVERVDADSRPIATIQIAGAQIADVAIEVFDVGV